MLRRFVATIIVPLAALAIVSCGIKGPLKPPPAKPAAPAATPETTPDAKPELPAPVSSPPAASAPPTQQRQEGEHGVAVVRGPAAPAAGLLPLPPRGGPYAPLFFVYSRA